MQALREHFPFLVQLCPNSAQTRAHGTFRVPHVPNLGSFPVCARRVSKITGRDDVVTIKYASGFVAGDGHGNALADASPHHVSHCRSPHIVEDQADILRYLISSIDEKQRLRYTKGIWLGQGLRVERILRGL